MILGQSGRKCFGLLHTLKHAGTHTQRHIHTYINIHRHTYWQTDTHIQWGAHTPCHTDARLILQATNFDFQNLPQLPLLFVFSATPFALFPLPTATKLDDFQLCSTSLPPLPHERCKREFVLLFFSFLALLARVGNVFTVNRGHLHTHTRTHMQHACAH